MPVVCSTRRAPRSPIHATARPPVPRGRRTVTSWIRAAGLSDRYRSCYLAVAAAGKQADRIAARLLTEVVRPLLRGGTRLTLALDDTPTKRYGPQVQGAGVHHNPTPGPAGSAYVYGHVFVVLGLLVTRNAWGTIALPLLARLYVRKKDLPAIDPKDRPPFRTKLELAVELLRWAKPWLSTLKLPIWVVADVAYAKAAFLKPAAALGMTVVSRLRKDSALRTVPLSRPPGRRGRPRTYGEGRIDLAKRGGQRRGWSSETFTLYRVATVKRYKTFLATWRPVGGPIRVVLVDEPTGWRAYFCTDTEASVADILGAVADRFSLETTFRDCKQVVGAGQQQVRFLWANIGAFHLCLWTFTMTEAWAWKREADVLVDRSTSPWDKSSRRPSHADKRRAWRRELLGEEIRAALRPGVTEAEIRTTADRLFSLSS
ncbi:transposase [Singulisphaera sp. Ch08]|uniref:Transposase n=1 Tax=Singulisphaera sp. Ch08 TaxID=3120278 RepID=A0AAU7C8E1_9BACT